MRPEQSSWLSGRSGRAPSPCCKTPWWASGYSAFLTRSQLDRTLLLWILPLCVAPPMFSKDVYSYLAQSEITARGLDPYQVGPAGALGVDNVLTRTVPNIWRDTPAPYGPLFLWIGRGITWLTGENIVSGIFLHRILALAGIALIVWALPRLARRCGVAAVSALWLGAANPLLLFHLVAGIHNEAMMIGLMLAGTNPPRRFAALPCGCSCPGWRLSHWRPRSRFQRCWHWDSSAWHSRVDGVDHFGRY